MENKQQKKPCYVYLLLCENQALYCGWTTDLKRRFHLHQNGKAAKYTRAHKVKELYCYFVLDDPTIARKLEYAIKQLSHKEKVLLKSLSSEQVVEQLLIKKTLRSDV